MNVPSFKGKKNIYMCRHCGYGFVTQDVDEGVTPFMTQCENPNCNNMAESFFYKMPQEVLADIVPAMEWYKPEPWQVENFSPAIRQHVEMGGLLPRKRGS